MESHYLGLMATKSAVGIFTTEHTEGTECIEELWVGDRSNNTLRLMLGDFAPQRETGIPAGIIFLPQRARGC